MRRGGPGCEDGGFVERLFAVVGERVSGHKGADLAGSCVFFVVRWLFLFFFFFFCYFVGGGWVGRVEYLGTYDRA